MILIDPKQEFQQTSTDNFLSSTELFSFLHWIKLIYLIEYAICPIKIRFTQYQYC